MLFTCKVFLKLMLVEFYFSVAFS